MRRGLLAVCLVILATAAGTTPTGAASTGAGRAGLWSNATGLIVGRESHTATLLRNGTVLIAGGTDGLGNVRASAEIYNPATNRWTPAGSMATPRLGQTATLLASGKVLVAGGEASPDPSTQASAELYDPATKTWSPAAAMLGPRVGHTATLLRDGRVLAVGGISLALRNGVVYASHPADAELYDPKTDRWSLAAPMAYHRGDQTATLLSDGRVLIAGGQELPLINVAPINLALLNSTEIYDAVNDHWILGAPMATGRVRHTASLLPNGHVLVVAGADQGPAGQASTGVDQRPPLSVSTEIYDPRVNQWVPGPDTGQEYVDHTATVLQDGRVLVVGAASQQPAEIYDPASKRWALTGPAMDRHRHTATLMRDGRVLIVGGFGNGSLKSAVVYDPNGLPPSTRHPIGPRTLATMLLLGLVAGAAIAWSVPSVRRRIRRFQRGDDGDEWISA